VYLEILHDSSNSSDTFYMVYADVMIVAICWFCYLSVPNMRLVHCTSQNASHLQ
jgi:hypothetical protein